MFIYWVIFLVLALGALLNQERDAHPHLPLMLFAAIPSALMIGLRWKIGPDWPAYESIYKRSGLYSFVQNLGRDDPAFKVLNWSLQQLHQPFWILNAICGLVFVAGLTSFCRRQTNPWLAYVVAFPYLVIVVAMSGDRQSVALGLLFFALNAFERGQLYRVVAFILAAALFHGSVLLMLPLCLLSYTRNTFQRMLLLLVAVALGVHFFQDTFSVYAHRYSQERIQSSGVAYRLAMNSMSAVLFLAFRDRLELPEHQAKLWRNVAFCSLGLVPMLAYVPSSTAIDRFLLYLFPIQFVVLSRIPKAMSRDGQMAMAMTFLVIGYAAAVQATFLTLGAFSQYYVPYHSIFER